MIRTAAKPSKLDQQRALLGAVPRPTAGERGPEAILPLPNNGKRLPVSKPSPKSKEKPTVTNHAADVPSLAELQKLPVHPMAARFPMWSKDRLAELAADIKANGQNIPIVIWTKEPMLLDGRNRLAACGLEGIEPRVEFFDGDDPRKLIISRNIQTREMTASQKAMLLAIEFPKGKQGKRSDLTSSDSEEVPIIDFAPSLLSDARKIVQWAGDLADRVAVGAVKFDVALKEAQRKKQEAASEEARFARLQDAAPDLARKVQEDDFALDEAEAAHNARMQREAQTRDKGKAAAERLRGITTEVITIGAAIEAGATELVTDDVLAVVADALAELQKLAADDRSAAQ